MSGNLAFKDDDMHQDSLHSIKPVHTTYIEAFEAYDRYLQAQLEKLNSNKELSPSEKQYITQILKEAREKLFAQAEEALNKAV